MRHQLRVVAVTSAAQLRSFIRLPDRLHRDDAAWVPPLLVHRAQALKPAGNPFFDHAEIKLFLAMRGDLPVGRVAAQVDRLAVAAHGPIGHFGLLAAEDRDSVEALMDAAELHLLERGMRAARGPFNLSINQESGLLVDGFDTPPAMMTPHDRPHLAQALEALGYAKAKDLLAYEVPVASPPPPFVRGLLNSVSKRLVIRPLEMSRYGDEIGQAVEVFNDAWAGNWGFVPFTRQEITALAENLRLLVDEDLVWFAELDGKCVGMLIALPDLNLAIADLRGRLLPWGWVKLLWRLKVAGLAGARVPLMGVRRSVSGMMAAAIPFALTEAVRGGLRRGGYTRVEMSWVLEDNLPMRRMAEALGGTISKTWRIFERRLT